MSAGMRRAAGVTLVLAVGIAACGGGKSSAGKGPTGPVVATVAVSARNFAFTPDKLTVPAGIIRVNYKSTDGGHTFVIQDVPGFKLSADSTGASDSGRVDLKPGTYTFYCDVPGHRELGMVGTLRVG